MQAELSEVHVRYGPEQPLAQRTADPEALQEIETQIQGGPITRVMLVPNRTRDRDHHVDLSVQARSSARKQSMQAHEIGDSEPLDTASHALVGSLRNLQAAAPTHEEIQQANIPQAVPSTEVSGTFDRTGQSSAPASQHSSSTGITVPSMIGGDDAAAVTHVGEHLDDAPPRPVSIDSTSGRGAGPAEHTAGSSPPVSSAPYSVATLSRAFLPSHSPVSTDADQSRTTAVRPGDMFVRERGWRGHLKNFGKQRRRSRQNLPP